MLNSRGRRSRGNTTFTLVPCPGWEAMIICPPKSCARSFSPINPKLPTLDQIAGLFGHSEPNAVVLNGNHHLPGQELGLNLGVRCLGSACERW